MLVHFVCMYVCVCVHESVHVHVCAYVCAHACVYASMYNCWDGLKVRMYVHTYIFTVCRSTRCPTFCMPSATTALKLATHRYSTNAAQNVCMYCMYCVHMHTVGTYVCICIQNFIVHTSMYVRTCVEVVDEHVMLTGQFARY